MTNRRRTLLLASTCLCLLLALAAGCSEGDPDDRVKAPVHPVRGEVFAKGGPLTGALVTLKPNVDAPDVPWPTGRVDAEGKFRLHTYVEGDGAPAGAYKIGVKLAAKPAENRNVMQKVAAKAPAKPPLSQAAAARFAEPDNSGLTFEIKAGDNEIPRINLDGN